MWIWPDRSPSMQFASPLVRDTKLYRTLVVALALAEVLVEGGERVGIPGLTRPTGSRNVVELIAQAIVHDRNERTSLPPNFAPSPLAEVVLLSDLWSEIGDVRRTLTQLSGSGAHGHVVQIVDPAEETFPIGAVSNSSSPKAAAASLPAAPKPGAPITPRASRVTAPRSAARPTGSAGASPSIAPTGRRANSFLLCTPASAPAAAHSATRLHALGRLQGCRDDRRLTARLCRTAGSRRPVDAAGAVVAAAIDSAAPAPHRLSADAASARNRAQGGDARPARRGGSL